jgi:ABC-2 type transport system ATP-binding protein
MALLGEPRLVILDEPTNGLDPQGIIDVRNAIRDLNRSRGMTFLISSHLLHEVEVTCTRVGILKQGKLVVQSDIRTLLQETAFVVRVESPAADLVVERARALAYVRTAEREPGGTVRITLAERRFAELNAALVQAGCAIDGFSPVRLTLEEFFVQ